MIPVRVLTFEPHRTYELSDLKEYFGEASSILPEPVKANADGNGTHGDNEFADIDPETCLEEMQYKGRPSIHQSQLAATASWTRRGVAMEEATRIVIEATRKAVAGDPRCTSWDWQEEEDAVVGMITDFIYKNQELTICLPDRFREKYEGICARGEKPIVFRNRYGWCARSSSVKAAEGNAEDKEAAAAATGKQQEEAPRAQASPPGKIVAKPFIDFDEASLPKRAWLYAQHYQRGQVTATIGPGGAGKSSLDLVEAIAMATAQPLLGEQPSARYRVWVHNGDDDAQELKRRIAAICRLYGIPRKELEGWLFITTKEDFQIKIAASGSGAMAVDRKTIAEIVNTIARNEIDVAIFEPLVTLHAVPENDNIKMNAVIHLFGDIANGCDCGIEVAHHTRKLMAGVEEHSVEDGRGASSIRDAVRGSRVLNPISREEARKAGIGEEERAFYFRVDRGKANYLPPGKATWRKFENQTLLNGDNVGVVTAWEFQESKGALSDADCKAVQDELHKHPRQWRENKQRTPERWVGRIVARLLKLNPNEEKNEWAIKRAIRDLENKGAITYENARMPGDTKEVSYAMPGSWKASNAAE